MLLLLKICYTKKAKYFYMIYVGKSICVDTFFPSTTTTWVGYGASKKQERRW